MPPLKNCQHERLVYEIAMGANHTEAARRAGYSAKYARVFVHRLLQRKDIADRLEELRKETITDRVSSILERKITLTNIIRSNKNDPRIIITAIAELNKMDGVYGRAGAEHLEQPITIKTIVVRPHPQMGPSLYLPPPPN